VISSCGLGLRPRFFFSCGFGTGGSGGKALIKLLISNCCNFGVSNKSGIFNGFRGGV
jgi:hypothetical protein